MMDFLLKTTLGKIVVGTCFLVVLNSLNAAGWAQVLPEDTETTGPPPDNNPVKDPADPEETETPDPCNPKDIEAKMQLSSGDFRFCWLSYRPREAVQIRRWIRWTINQDGRVNGISVEPGVFPTAPTEPSPTTPGADPTPALPTDPEPGVPVETPEFDKCLADVLGVVRFLPLKHSGVCNVTWFDDFTSDAEAPRPPEDPDIIADGSNIGVKPEDPLRISPPDKISGFHIYGGGLSVGFGAQVPAGRSSFALPSEYGTEFYTAFALDFTLHLWISRYVATGLHVLYATDPINFDGWAEALDTRYAGGQRWAVGPIIEGTYALSGRWEVYLRLELDWIMLGTTVSAPEECEDPETGEWTNDCGLDGPGLMYWGFGATAGGGVRYYFTDAAYDFSFRPYMFLHVSYAQGVWLDLTSSSGPDPEILGRTDATSMFLGFFQSFFGIGLDVGFVR